MTNQTEVLKMALAEFENQRAGLAEVGITDHSLDELITVIKEALAQQSNKQAEPLKDLKLIHKADIDLAKKSALEAQQSDSVSNEQVEPYAIEAGYDNGDGTYSVRIERLPRGLNGRHKDWSKLEKLLYTHPPVLTVQPKESNKDGSLCPEFWDWLPKAYNFEGDGNFTKYNMEVAFLAGKQAAQPKESEQEPVAFITPLMEQQLFDDWCPYKGNPDPRVVWAAAIDAVNGLLIGATRPQRKPLTDEQVTQVANSVYGETDVHSVELIRIDFARAIEAAHGIKE